MCIRDRLKTAPAAEMIKKACGIKKGSSNAGTTLSLIHIFKFELISNEYWSQQIRYGYEKVLFWVKAWLS